MRLGVKDDLVLIDIDPTIRSIKRRFRTPHSPSVGMVITGGKVDTQFLPENI